MVENDKKKRFQWPMGRIMEIKVSPDGETRVATVKTSRGCINRSLRRLHLLEMSSDARPEVATGNSITNPQHESSPVRMASIDGTVDVDASETKATRSGRKINKPLRYTEWNN